MINILLASLFLPLSHFLMSSATLRAPLVYRMGEKPFLLAYSVVALLPFAWLIMAYRQAPTIVLRVKPAWVRAALLPVELLAVVLVVAGLSTPNPVIVSADSLFERANIVQGVMRVTRNAFFWGTGLFAVAHLVLTGHVSGVLASLMPKKREAMEKLGAPSRKRRQTCLFWQSPKAASVSRGPRSGCGASHLE